MIYVNITNIVNTKFNTGIQRVVTSIGLELAKLNRYTFVSYNYNQKTYLRLKEFNDLYEAIYNGQGAWEILPASILQPEDIFFDIDSAWSDFVDRHALYSELKRRGVRIVTMHYDSVPFINSQWSHPSTVLKCMDYTYSKMMYSDFIFYIAQCVKDEFEDRMKESIGIVQSGMVIPMGVLPKTVDENKIKSRKLERKFKKILDRPFFLSVGTIEPRKNYKYLIDAYKNAQINNSRFILVGREGWNVSDFIEELEALPEFGDTIVWYNNINDRELVFLYKRCHAYITASCYEGYGLPAIEALSFGTPTVVSNGGALPEAVGGCAEIFNLENMNQLEDILSRLVSDEAYQKSLRDKAKHFTGISWAHVASVLDRQLVDLESNALQYDFFEPVSQIVYISVEPEKFALSIKSVCKYMKFIDNVVLLTRSELVKKYERILACYNFKYVIVTDEELLVDVSNINHEHQPRNTFLRGRLYQHQAIAENFIASDDDYLAITKIKRDYYQTTKGHRAYYFWNDLQAWLGDEVRTSYDIGLVKTGDLLWQLGFQCRGYSAHMPQIINKKLINEIFEKYLVGLNEYHIDEWSIYFNIAVNKVPKLIHPCHYETLYWPGNASDWVTEIVPPKFTFCNYYPDSDAFLGLRKITGPHKYQAELLKTREYEWDENGTPFAVFVSHEGVSVSKPVMRLSPGTDSHHFSKRVFVNYRQDCCHNYQLMLQIYDSNMILLLEKQIILGTGNILIFSVPSQEGIYSLKFSLVSCGECVHSAEATMIINKMPAGLYTKKEQIDWAEMNRWAIRLIYGREPKSSKEIDKIFSDITHFQDEYFYSEEYISFRRKYNTLNEDKFFQSLFLQFGVASVIQWGYRVFLGRDPENVSIFLNKRYSGLQQFQDSLQLSSEFINLRKRRAFRSL